MISLAGFVPEEDVGIEFVGIRDGEKLHEELFDDNEMLEATDMPGIQLARSDVESLIRMRELRDRILQSGSSGDAQAIIAMLREALAERSHGTSTRRVEGQKGMTAKAVCASTGVAASRCCHAEV
jgi:FlaA1/EpsC-like NDP-sugar epimerase